MTDGTVRTSVDVTGRLSGRVAIVTGGGTSAPIEQGVGTGRAIAELFARAGAAVVVVDADEAAGRRTCEAIEEAGGRSALVAGDVRLSEAAVAAVDAAVGQFGRLDALVNNVAVTSSGGAADVSEDEWSRVLGINLTGAFLMTRHAVPAMVATGGGSVVNISSVSAVRGFGMAAYAASKGGLDALTIDTAVAYGDRGIRANAVVPGHVATPMVTRMGADERGADLRRRSAPLGTTGTGWDVAHAALFLAGDESRWITGAAIPVDAGLLTVVPMKMLARLVGEPGEET